MIYSYIVKKRHLTDVEKESLQGRSEVLSSLPSRHLQKLYCADFQFPNGDTFVLRPRAIDLTSAIALD